MQCFREHKQPTVHIQHVSTRPGATIFLPGSEGTHIHDAVAHFEGEPLVQKHFPNAFRETNLLDLLKGWEIERVIVCGMMTHMCVDATARAAADLGFQVGRCFGCLRHKGADLWRDDHSLLTMSIRLSWLL